MRLDPRSGRIHAAAYRDHAAQRARINTPDPHRVPTVALDQLMVGLVR